MKLRAFTLIELLATLGVVVLLAALLFPIAGRSVEKSRQARCAANLRQIFQATLAWSNENEGLLPRGGEGGGPLWSDTLAPYLGMEVSTYGSPAGSRPQKVFACPSSRNVTSGGSRSDYGNNFFVFGDGSTPQVKLLSIAQPSKTIAYIDSGNPSTGLGVRSVADFMGANWGIQFRHGDIKTPSGSYANAVYLDGHVAAAKAEDLSLTQPNAYKRSPWSRNPE